MKILTGGTIKRIHVDRQVLASNRKTGGDKPAWTIQTSKGSIKCRAWQALGLVWADPRPKQLSCGARMYLVTRSTMRYE